MLQLLFQIWLEWTEDITVPIHHRKIGKYSFKDVNDVVLVWWTPFTGNAGSFLECGALRCFITQDRHFQYHPKFQMFLFYGSNINIFDLPLPRNDHDIWSLLHEESPRNIPFLSHRDGISLFNHTATFSRHSDVPLTLQYVRSMKSITDGHYVVDTEVKNILLKNLAPVLYIQSDCDTPLDRDKYVESLMEHVSIDSYGKCLHNKNLPDSLSNAMETINSEEFLHFVAQYKFTIAFENAVCDDYITEKLWRPLSVGSIPIYMGSPSIQDWLPNPNSAILAENFSSPRELAAFILELNEDDDKYSSFLSHKKGIVNNHFFVSEMQSRPWALPEDGGYHFIDHFECQMCLRAHQNANGNVQGRTAHEKEYFCPKPKSSVSKLEEIVNPWLHLWEYGKCEASVLTDFIHNNHWSINETVFHSEVESRFRKGSC